MFGFLLTMNSNKILLFFGFSFLIWKGKLERKSTNGKKCFEVRKKISIIVLIFYVLMLPQLSIYVQACTHIHVILIWYIYVSNTYIFECIYVYVFDILEHICICIYTFKCIHTYTHTHIHFINIAKILLWLLHGLQDRKVEFVNLLKSIWTSENFAILLMN